ncbi:MAG: TonB-dependent receptor [Melioribacteraceae bacterium]|nr:TonB-dependent receptor [Melioribacteraceae bacterium]
MKKHLLLSLFFSLIFASTMLFAGSSGKLAGTVIDKETGEPLPFANVFVDGTTMGAATDIDGNFVILNVAPGLYNITASVVGFQKVTITDVRVNVDFTTRLEFELSSGSVEMDAVVVEGIRDPLIRQDLTNPTVAINAETIAELPVDQISDLIKLQSGVTVGDDGQIHMRGGFGNETAYTLNGVSLNDPYNNKSSIGLATNAVQEVSISSGTFSAEYGNALSGLVNYVTREGGNKFSFSLRGYAGDYITNRTALFPNIDDVNPLNRARMEATLGGPIVSNSVKFFVSGIYEKFDGLYEGTRIYNTTDSYLSRESFTGADDPRFDTSTEPYWFNPYSNDTTGLPTGDGAFVQMNPSTNINLQGNLIFNISSLIKLRYEAVYDKGDWKNYSPTRSNSGRRWKFNPDGVGTNYSNGLIQTLDLTHAVNQNMFYTLKASYGYNAYQYYLYEDINDPRYLPSQYQLGISNTGFRAGGTDLERIDRSTRTMTFKGDMVAQMGNHELKFGFEARQHKLEYERFNVELLTADSSKISNEYLLYDRDNGFIQQRPSEEPLLTEYKKEPVDAAIYVVDKMELANNFILNVGLRYEYFDAKSKYNNNLTSDLEDLKDSSMYRSLAPTEAKHYLSPRLSISYPITAESVIRFSYGHFFQNGSLSSLYRNDKFFVTNVGSTPTFGNANVDMQRSIQYEMGLQQQLTENLKVELTGYYKDVRDYIYYQTVFTGAGREYRVLTNLAYSNVRGASFRLERRRNKEDLFYGTLDYTFQIAEANRTEPVDEIFFSEASGKLSETYLVPLSFDRTHVLNITFGLYDSNNWSFGLIYNLQTGTPYTPAYPPSVVPITFNQNSDYQLIQQNLDFKLEKFFTTGDFEWSVFLWISNVLDNQNELTVYPSTGRALSTIEETNNPTQFNNIRNRIEGGEKGLFDISEIDNYYTGRPERVNRPREVRLGFSLNFN